jgi:hypothetical protein
MASQEFVILASRPPGPDGSMAPLASRSELLDRLATCNTAPETPGEDVLHGPGIRIELPPGQDPVTQMLLTIIEEDIGWMVLMRMAIQFHWKVLDPESGREYSPRRDD